MILEDYKVVKHNFLINAKSNFTYTLNEQKLICHLIANILPSDTNFDLKVVAIKDLDFINIDARHYSSIGKEFEKLLEKPFTLPNGYKVNWFSCIKYENGFIEYSFDTRLKPYLLELKGNYTPYNLSNVMFLKNQYSIKIFELLYQLHDRGYRTMYLKDFRECLNIPEGYRNNDIGRLLERVQQDLKEHTIIQFDFKMEKSWGKEFDKIDFKIKNNKKIKGVSYTKSIIK